MYSRMGVIFSDTLSKVLYIYRFLCFQNMAIFQINVLRNKYHLHKSSVFYRIAFFQFKVKG